jgi:hypothetical protein
MFVAGREEGRNENQMDKETFNLLKRQRKIIMVHALLKGLFFVEASSNKITKRHSPVQTFRHHQSRGRRVCIHAYWLCVCVCERESEREKERESVLSRREKMRMRGVSVVEGECSGITEGEEGEQR